jgi:putative ABC transport system permease protein
VRRLDPGLPVHDVRTMEQVMAGSPAVLARRYPLLIMASFAGAALMLALVGVYGVVSYAVARRSRELAIRAALGAARRQLLLPVLGHGAVLAGVGIGSGALLAVAISRFLSGLLYGVSTLDLPTYLSVGVLLMLVTIVATLVPARRAASAMPAAALQSE